MADKVLKPNSSRGRLCVCARYKAELNHLTSICERYFGDYLIIDSCYVSDLDKLTTLPDAFLSTALTYTMVPEKYPKIRNIYIERSMTGQNLELLIMVPRGSKVLIVNSPRISAEDSVAKLNELELRGLELVPYWPGADMDVSEFKYAAYFGIEAYLPVGNFTPINLGNRNISLEVIIEIINFFNLPASVADKYYKENIDNLVTRAETISTMLKSAEQSLSNFKMACDINSSIVFSLDKDGCFNIFNAAAERFFDIKRERVLGRNYLSIFSDFPDLVELLERREAVTEHILNYQGQNLVVSATKYSVDEYENILVSMVSVPELQNSESQIRRRLRKNDFTAKYTFNYIKGKSNKIAAAREFANICAQSDATILLTGESGTGKELFAQSIHNASSRAAEPFVGINFAALPESLAESELFGYEEGAFTGAVKGGKQGLFELAHCGTIFLDEIGDASLAMQTKLLRVLEEREVVRVGGSKIIPINVRVICATNKNLKKMVADGTFREDLYYRIKVLTMSIPPLRQRKEDIPVLLRSMLGEADMKNFISEDIMSILMSADWPGNTRELRAVAEYVKVLGILKAKGKYPDEVLCGMLRDYLMENMEFGTESVRNGDQTFEPQTGGYELPDEDMILILKAISKLKSRGITVGRGTLAKMKELEDAGLTESKIKTRLAHLEREGYISVGRTKQGASLTEKGRMMTE